MSYGLSRALNLKFFDNPLENIIGYTYEELNIESYAEKINNLFSFNYVNKRQTVRILLIYFLITPPKNLSLPNKNLMEANEIYFTGYLVKILKK